MPLRKLWRQGNPPGRATGSEQRRWTDSSQPPPGTRPPNEEAGNNQPPRRAGLRRPPRERRQADLSQNGHIPTLPVCLFFRRARAKGPSPFPHVHVRFACILWSGGDTCTSAHARPRNPHPHPRALYLSLFSLALFAQALETKGDPPTPLARTSLVRVLWVKTPARESKRNGFVCIWVRSTISKTGLGVAPSKRSKRLTS